MARSMTGFGQAQAQIAGSHYSVEIRSLNSRYFKATIRLPELWAGFENEADRLLRDKLRRGAIYFVMRMKSESADAAYHVNTAVLDAYMTQLEIVRPEQADLKITLDLGSLLLLPGVCTPPPAEEIIAKAEGEVTKLISQAADAVLAMRAQEGKAVANDLMLNCQLIHRQLIEVQKRSPAVVQEYHVKLKRRVDELLAASGATVAQEDLAREVAVFAERCDVAEEISRLAGHLQQFALALEKEDQPGRKLDFLAQEMLREANTVGSKASDSAIGRAVVEIKTAIDRIKEQVQNVE